MTTERSVDKQAARLLNRRRVWQGAILFVPSALAVLFPSLIGQLLNAEALTVAAAAALPLVMGLYWSASGATCSGCKLNLLWYAMTHARNADWFTWVVNVHSCPRCGYPESDSLGRKAK